MIYKSVPVFLESIRLLPAETKARLIPMDNEKASTFGFRVDHGGSVTYEIEMDAWRQHYGSNFGDPASKIEALTRWRADIRKLLIPSREDAHYDPYAINDRPPTAWARLLKDD